MSRREYVILVVLASALALPVILGVSCPPPTMPPFVSVSGVPSAGDVGVPPCEADRVCVSIVNQTCTEAEIILYVHDGYDLDGDYVTRTALECCENENADAPCPCFRDGSDNGELQLLRPELFQAINRWTWATGEEVYALAGRSSALASRGGSILQSFPCEEVKSIGLEVAPVDELPARYADRQGPDYRCTMVEFDRASTPMPEDVACGETIRYNINDRNDCVDPDLTTYRIAMEVSDGCDADGVTP